MRPAPPCACAARRRPAPCHIPTRQNPGTYAAAATGSRSPLPRRGGPQTPPAHRSGAEPWICDPHRAPCADDEAPPSAVRPPSSDIQSATGTRARSTGRQAAAARRRRFRCGSRGVLVAPPRRQRSQTRAWRPLRQCRRPRQPGKSRTERCRGRFDAGGRPPIEQRGRRPQQR